MDVRREVEVTGLSDTWRGWYIGPGGVKDGADGYPIPMILIESGSGQIHNVEYYKVKFVKKDEPRIEPR